MDYFLDDNNVIARLVSEWREHGKIIIAIDFDSTIYDYYREGYTYDNVITLLKECREVGAYIIVFTSSNEDRYDFIKQYMNDNQIPFDKINEDMEFILFKGRKLYYNILLDDRSGLKSAYECLSKAKDIVKSSLK